MITLKARNLEWIKKSHDDPNDQCAHGRVQFQVNETHFVKPEDGIWTVSASALYLLRSLTHDHSIESSIAEENFLFPCCGFNAWPIGTRFTVMCMGCGHGVDIEILHHADRVTLRSPLGSETISQSEWQTAVLAFASSIQTFYDACSPKTAIEEEFDRQGWVAFWQEWRARYANAITQ